MVTELKTLTTLQTKLKKKYDKQANKPLGDALLDLQTLIRTLKKVK